MFFVNSENDWDFYWCDVGNLKECFDHGYLAEHVRLCHFRNHYEVCSVMTNFIYLSIFIHKAKKN